jgi:hypothetical protein
VALDEKRGIHRRLYVGLDFGFYYWCMGRNSILSVDIIEKIINFGKS